MFSIYNFGKKLNVAIYSLAEILNLIIFFFIVLKVDNVFRMLTVNTFSIEIRKNIENTAGI